MMNYITKAQWQHEGTTVYALEVERENVITGKPIMRNRFSALVQGYIPKEELEANARLMAAAPDLLKALQTVLNKQYHAVLPSEWVKVHAAINKALGE
jgi:hypothetical protein